MLTRGAFKAEVSRAWDVCRELRLGEWRNASAAYPSDAPALSRSAESYHQEWQGYVQRAEYDFLLVDGALLQFKYRPDEHHELSYAYYDCPLDVAPYSDFVRDHYGEAAEASGSYSAWDEYEMYRDQQPLKPAITPIRYDYSPPLYHEGVHPASHLHLGYRSEVRIQIAQLMRPVGFLLFVVRHAYPHVWERAFLPSPDAAVLAKEIRDNPEPVPDHLDCGVKDAWHLCLR